MTARALYLHVPFCVRKCAYCDFASFETPREDPLMDAYAAGLERLVVESLDAGILMAGGTAYVGGGTPTLLADALPDLVASVRRHSAPCELTYEANPDSLTLDMSLRLYDAGATRVSVGVQSVHDDELSVLGRIHDGRRALETLGQAVSAGLDVSADLMCAIPLQTSESWVSSLCSVVDAGVSHVSVYPLMIEEGTPFARAVDKGEYSLPDDNDEALFMEQASSFLASRGFTRYEVASYALPGHSCRHNQAYWTGVSYLGIGTAASSMFDLDEFEVLFHAFPQLERPSSEIARIRMTCTSDRRFLATHHRLADQSFDVELLTEREALAEDLMLGARMSCGPSKELVSRARDAMGFVVDDTLASLIDDGYLTTDLAPTEKGWLLGNELYGRLWDLARNA